MYAYFDDTKRFWYYLLFTYILCFPLYILLRSMEISVLFTFIIVFVSEFICYMIIINYTIQKANGYMKSIEDTLYQDCDVQKFQSEVTTLLQKSVKNQTQRCKLQNLMAISFLLQGNIKDGLAILEAMKEDIDRLSSLQKLPIYITMSHAYMEDANLEQARITIQDVHNCKQNMRSSEVYKDAIEEVYHRYRYIIGEESSHEYIAFLKQLCKEKANTPVHILFIYTKLMELSKRTKNEKEGKLCAYYIVKHAKDLPCVDAANKLLEGMYE